MNKKILRFMAIFMLMLVGVIHAQEEAPTIRTFIFADGAQFDYIGESLYYDGNMMLFDPNGTQTIIVLNYPYLMAQEDYDIEPDESLISLLEKELYSNFGANTDIGTPETLMQQEREVAYAQFDVEEYTYQAYAVRFSNGNAGIVVGWGEVDPDSLALVVDSFDSGDLQAYVDALEFEIPDDWTLTENEYIPPTEEDTSIIVLTSERETLQEAIQDFVLDNPYIELPSLITEVQFDAVSSAELTINGVDALRYDLFVKHEVRSFMLLAIQTEPIQLLVADTTYYSPNLDVFFSIAAFLADSAA